jgi:hypothetical protein
VGTVGAAALLGGLVDLDVLDNASIEVKTLSLSVGLGVLQESQDVLARLDGPTALGNTPNLSLGAATDTTVEAAERNSLLVINDIGEERLSLLQAHTLNSHGSFTGVLEVNTEVSTLGLARLGLVLWLIGVHHLQI